MPSIHDRPGSSSSASSLLLLAAVYVPLGDYMAASPPKTHTGTGPSGLYRVIRVDPGR